LTARTTPPFRADHVGSLLRPPTLLQARADHAAGRIDAAALRTAEDVAIAEGVRLQEGLGFLGVTDGEMRRGSWHMDFLYRIGGVSVSDKHMKVKFQNAEGNVEFSPALHQVDGKLHLAETIFGAEFTTLEGMVRQGVPKLTIPSPSMIHYRGGAAVIAPDVYDDMEDFWTDLSAVYRDEIARLWEIGCTYLQLDDTSLAYLNDPNQRAEMAARGDDGEHLHVRYIQNMNKALEGRPEGMTIATHMCRGNFRSSWVAVGGYDFVAEAMFNDLAVDGFFMEWDDERSGGFEPLRFVPKGKYVVLGLVTTKKGALETKDEIKRRIHEAAQYLDLDQMCLSPQCGFSSTVDGNALTADEQTAKLRLVAEVAQEVWA
jgi:5-methyltetrahydropteroyltriglutamate--homocysteine methyltransferase